MISMAFFNNKGGVGKTTLVYHLAHMMQRLGHSVLTVDLDPQANLTAAFLSDDELARLWDDPDLLVGQGELPLTETPVTIAQAVRPILAGTGDVELIAPAQVTDGLWLIAGDLDLSRFEARLSDAWPRSYTGTDEASIRTTTAFHRVIRHAARKVRADMVLIDVGPNLGAINRAALLAADTVVVPLAADLFSLRGLHNLGPTLREWRRIWQRTIKPEIPPGIDAPSGAMAPLGYIIMQPSVRLDRPVKAYHRWLERIPFAFASDVLDDPDAAVDGTYEIATIRNYRGLMPLAHDARKPMFDLRAADGAIGSTQKYVQICYSEFEDLARTLAGRLMAASD